MRTLFLVTIFLFTGFISFAHCIGPNKQMNSIKKGSALTFLALPAQSVQEQGGIYNLRRPKKSNAVGIYKFKNTKVKRALAFKTKWNKPVLA